MAHIELGECGRPDQGGYGPDDIGTETNAANDALSWQPNDDHQDDQVHDRADTDHPRTSLSLYRGGGVGLKAVLITG